MKGLHTVCVCVLACVCVLVCVCGLHMAVRYVPDSKVAQCSWCLTHTLQNKQNFAYLTIEKRVKNMSASLSALVSTQKNYSWSYHPSGSVLSLMVSSCIWDAA